MLENDPTGLERAEFEQVVEKQCNKFPRQHQQSKALSVSKDTTTADRGKEKSRRARNQFESNRFNCGRKGHPALRMQEREEDRTIWRCGRRQEGWR